MSAPSLLLVVVPARDEAELLGPCLDALAVARSHPRLADVEVRTVVVCDRCQDATAEVSTTRGVSALTTDHGDVGRARAAGISALIAAACDDPRLPGAWLASTDADSEVAADWLAVIVEQAAAGADAVVGVVELTDPPPGFHELYTDADGPGPHPHVHGACLAVSAAAYAAVGGFHPGTVGEDQDLVDRLDLTAAAVVRSTALRVRTSGRRASRVDDGFAGVLRDLDRAAQARAS